MYLTTVCTAANKAKQQRAGTLLSLERRICCTDSIVVKRNKRTCQSLRIGYRLVYIEQNMERTRIKATCVCKGAKRACNSKDHGWVASMHAHTAVSYQRAGLVQTNSPRNAEKKHILYPCWSWSGRFRVRHLQEAALNMRPKEVPRGERAGNENYIAHTEKRNDNSKSHRQRGGLSSTCCCRLHVDLKPVHTHRLRVGTELCIVTVRRHV